MKLIKINTPWGQFGISQKEVAAERADYYIIKQENTEYRLDWDEEFKYGIEYPYDLIEWMINHTDWEEWEASSFKLTDKVLVAKDSFWKNVNDFSIEKY